MSKPFDYSKWDKLELSDDEDDVHPNIDRESWFRMKHRSRVEREEREEADKKRIRAEMQKANQRLKVLEHDLAKLVQSNKEEEEDDDDDDDEDDDLGEGEGIKAEMEELRQANAARQAKLDDYERNKVWNVDNICHVKEERTVVNPDAAKPKFTPEGFALPPEPEAEPSHPPSPPVKKEPVKSAPAAKEGSVVESTTAKAEPAAEETAVTEQAQKLQISTKPEASSSQPPSTVASTTPPVAKTTTDEPGPTREALGSMATYHEFTEMYADLVEEFMAIHSLEQSKDFLLKHGDIILQENASNYLLLASLEDEMNGHREKMRQTARQSQIVTNIAELAKSLNTHPGNVIVPFFKRLEQREFFTQFLEGVEAFVQRIAARAVKKKMEMDRERAGEEDAEAVDLASIPREERLGPGGLDPLEVIETLPQEMQDAFASRDVEQLKEALLKLDPKEAEEHMKRCIDSGLWVSQA